MRSAALLATLLCPLLAQTPAKGTKAFFLQDPKLVIAACTEESMTLERDRDHGETNLEWGRAFLAAGRREKAEALFSRARPMLSPEYHSRLEATAWLRTGHRGEALALLLSPPFSQSPAGGLFKGAQLLFGAGYAALAQPMVLRGHEREPGESEPLLDCAEVAGACGATEEAVKVARWAVDSAPTKALVLATAGRIVAESLRTSHPPSRTAPQALAMKGVGIPPARRIALLATVPIRFGPGSTFPYGTGETQFNKAQPDRERFRKELVADMAQALGEAPRLEPEGGERDPQALARQLGTHMESEDRLVAIEELYMGMEEVSRSTTSEGFLMTRIRLVAYDRAGTRLHSHTYSIVTKVNDGAAALAVVRQWVRGFLSGPGFPYWLE